MLKIISPFDLKTITELEFHTENDLENALSIAHHLFCDISKWIPLHKRIQILKKASKLMKEDIEMLSKTAAQEGGKPYIDSKIEVLRAINGVELAVEHLSNLKGNQVPMGITSSSEGRVAFTEKEPIGVVVAISAFNHPLNLIVHQAVTAIAAGCPVIIKPALTTPLSCLSLVNILKRSGLPEGYCQVLICEDQIAEKLATDKRVNYLTFIGSARVGWHLRSKLSPGTRCALEHGGIAPVIVEKDADLEKLLPALVKGGFYHAGQVCVSVQRVFIHASIFENVANGLKESTEKLIVGDPLNPNTEIGPMILPKEVDRVDEWVKEAINSGAKLLCGGQRISSTCYAPTILIEPPVEAKVSSQEIFGPVICLYSFTNRDKAIELANDTNFHFQAAIFTKDINVAMDTTKKLNAAAVMINDHTAFRVDWMPFGGRDASGLGVGGIKYSMEEMSREKLTVIKL